MKNKLFLVKMAQLINSYPRCFINIHVIYLPEQLKQAKAISDYLV